MAYAITSQKRGKITRDIVATFTYAAAALDALAAKCPPEMMDYFTPVTPSYHYATKFSVPKSLRISKSKTTG